MKKKIVLVATLISSAGGNLWAQDADLIEYRQHIMQTMRHELAAIQLIIDQRAPADGLQSHAKVLAYNGVIAKKAFEADIYGGNAKDEVWSNPVEFAQRLQTLVDTANQLAKSDPVAAKDLGTRLTAACKSCHDQFRIPKAE